MEEWIEEFLFRGRPPSGPGSDMPREFQVTVGQQVANPFDATLPPSRRTIGPLTPAQAAEAGWPIQRLVEGINAAALAELDEARAALTAARQDLEAVQERIAALTGAQAPAEDAQPPAD
nr:hypothetical protein [Mesorhizobium sp.]